MTKSKRQKINERPTDFNLVLGRHKSGVCVLGVEGTPFGIFDSIQDAVRYLRATADGFERAALGKTDEQETKP